MTDIRCIDCPKRNNKVLTVCKVYEHDKKIKLNKKRHHVANICLCKQHLRKYRKYFLKKT